jgi:hypothetical protein
MTLAQIIENHRFSPEAENMFCMLAKNGPRDEGMLVVIAAAAFILSRDFPEKEAVAEAEALLASVRADMHARDPRPKLRLVGCSDV